MLVTVNNRLKFEIEIVHDLSCHPILTLASILEYGVCFTVRDRVRHGVRVRMGSGLVLNFDLG